jgi:VanZ family protein
MIPHSHASNGPAVPEEFRHMLIRWLPVVLWIAVILGLSSIPSHTSTGPLFPGFDKLAHMGVYGVLGFLFARARTVPGQSRWKIVLWSAMFGLLMGSCDEWYQRGIPGRMSDVFDVVADVLGGALGGAAWWRWQQRRLRMERSR